MMFGHPDVKPCVRRNPDAVVPQRGEAGERAARSHRPHHVRSRGGVGVPPASEPLQATDRAECVDVGSTEADSEQIGVSRDAVSEIPHNGTIGSRDTICANELRYLWITPRCPQALGRSTCLRSRTSPQNPGDSGCLRAYCTHLA